jgi:hypothetical protein
LSLLALAAAGMWAPILKGVEVGAPAINCVFSPTCTLSVQDRLRPIPLPGCPTQFFLQSRTFPGQPGTPAAGLYGYEYRIDLTNPCFTNGLQDYSGIIELALPFGPHVKLDFDGSGTLSDLYVITNGSGSIYPTGIYYTLSGSVVHILFDSGGLPTLVPGYSSLFIGMVSAQPPAIATAAINPACSSCSDCLSVGITCPQSIIIDAPRLLELVHVAPLGWQLNWPTGAVLQASSLVAGPYNDLVGIASPLTITPLAAQQFFRLKLPVQSAPP